MQNLKHVGRISKNNRRVIVAYRVVPDEPDNCIVITTENLSAEEHDTLMKLVESTAGQEANELAPLMARTSLPDGRIMLSWFHQSGKMIKVSTKDVDMIPNRNTTINLSELNEAIAQQKGVTVADLAVKPSTSQQTQSSQSHNTEATVAAATDAVLEPEDGVLTDEQLASQYRSQADAMFKEAKRLREQAEELSPSKKKTAIKKTEKSA